MISIATLPYVRFSRSLRSQGECEAVRGHIEQLRYDSLEGNQKSPIPGSAHVSPKTKGGIESGLYGFRQP
jgi:hypothetical protein